MVAVLLAPVSIGGLRAFPYGVVWVLKDETYIQLGILCLYQEVFLAIGQLKKPLGFYDYAVRQDEVRGVFVVAGRYSVGKIALLVYFMAGGLLYLQGYLIFQS